MDRAFKSGASATPPTAPASPSIGYANEGNPGASIPATKPGPWWFHMITEELLGIVLAAGITPAQGTLTQIKQALDALYMPIAGGGSATVQGAFKNLAVSATGLSANITVTADEIVVENSSNAYKTLRAVNLTIAGTSVGANGLDSGALATNTWYSLWVIWNGTTTAGLMSLSATSPTLPSGYTHKARVGWVRTDGTANKYPQRFFQFGRKVRFSVGGNVAGMPIMASGALGNVATPTWSAVAVSAFVPPTATVICAAVINNTVGVVAIAAPNTSFGGTSSVPSNPPPLMSAATANSGTYYSPADMILEGPNIYYAGNAAACYLFCFGYEDNI